MSTENERGGLEDAKTILQNFFLMTEQDRKAAGINDMGFDDFLAEQGIDEKTIEEINNTIKQAEENLELENDELANANKLRDWKKQYEDEKSLEGSKAVPMSAEKFEKFQEFLKNGPDPEKNPHSPTAEEMAQYYADNLHETSQLVPKNELTNNPANPAKGEPFQTTDINAISGEIEPNPNMAGKTLIYFMDKTDEHGNTLTAKDQDGNDLKDSKGSPIPIKDALIVKYGQNGKPSAITAQIGDPKANCTIGSKTLKNVTDPPGIADEVKKARKDSLAPKVTAAQVAPDKGDDVSMGQGHPADALRGRLEGAAAKAPTTPSPPPVAQGHNKGHNQGAGAGGGVPGG